jgi:hypothetical protein
MMQIMELTPLSGHDQGDWEWTGQFKRSTCDLEGCSIQLFDPTIIHSTCSGRDQMPTYSFQSAELITIAAVLYGNICSKIDALPIMPWCKMFPYWTPNGRCYMFSTSLNINPFFTQVQSVLFARMKVALMVQFRTSIDVHAVPCSG